MEDWIGSISSQSQKLIKSAEVVKLSIKRAIIKICIQRINNNHLQKYKKTIVNYPIQRPITIRIQNNINALQCGLMQCGLRSKGKKQNLAQELKIGVDSNKRSTGC